MSSIDAAERRRQQNREAQRKRRDALKLKIQELHASNLELRAFKEATLRSSRSLISPSPSAAPTSDLPWHCTSSLENDRSREISEKERETTTTPFTTSSHYLPTVEDGLLTIDGSRSFETSRPVDLHRAHRKAGGFEQVSSPSDWESRSGRAGEAADTLSPSPWLDTTTVVLSGNEDDARGYLGSSDLDSDMGFDCLQAVFPSPNSKTQTVAGGERRPETAVKQPLTPISNSVDSHREKWHKAMQVAIKNGQASIVRLLVKHGANVNAYYDKGRTALHHVAETNDFEMARLLIDSGADFKAVDQAGMTALEVAASLGNVQTAEVLIRASTCEGSIC